MTDQIPPGLDMKGAIEWYTHSGIQIAYPKKSELPRGVTIEGQEHMDLTETQLAALYNRFSPNAQERSILTTVIGEPTRWFDKNSRVEKKSTTDPNERLSPTSIIPGETAYPENKPGNQIGVVYLYKTPNEIANAYVRGIIAAQAYIHEIGHTIVQPALYSHKNQIIEFPSGKRMSNKEAMLTFQNLAEKSIPISEYAALHRDKHGLFEEKQGDNGLALSEELCETIAAYLLGFTYHGNNSGSKDPFINNYQIREFTADFLEAKLVR